ncbi:MAG: branched-chain amino acid ABC transporter permease [Nitrososphaerota archaeon]|nr:branched-chain amino acid ABC transporter permease [Nitrososphaerota archaeon]
MLDTLFFQSLIGLSTGMFLWVVAAGLTLIFGVAKVLNFAHGSLYMLGAYLTYSFFLRTGNFWLGLLIATLITAFVGGIMERFFIRKIYHLDVSFQLLLTFAFILILDDLVKMIWGPVYAMPPMPEGFRGGVSIMGRMFPIYSLFIIAVGPLVALGLWLFLNTKWGRMVRAAASDREMAEAVGINVKRLFTCVFMFGSGLAAIGGGLRIPMFNISPGMGIFLIIDLFIIVVIGGLGSLKGAFIGAILLGQFEALGLLFIPEFYMAFSFMLMAAVLLIRPWGIFGKP